MSGFYSVLGDNLSGSSEILHSTIESLILELDSGSDPSVLRNDLYALCERFPTMALLKNLFNYCDPITKGKIREWDRLYHEAEKSACEQFSSHLSQFSSVLVHSNSGLVKRSLIMTDRVLDVYCTESRPAFEGRLLAENLSRLSRHKIHLLSDLAAFEVIPGVDLLAFGCDALTNRGIVNKIGTAALAREAKSCGRPCYFVATNQKKLESLNEIAIKVEGLRDEIYAGPEPLLVENRYYDLTTREHITGVFLEGGPVSDW